MLFENFIQKMSVSELSNTRVLLYVNKIYIRENKYLFEIYAIVNKIMLCPMEMNHMLVT